MELLSSDKKKAGFPKPVTVPRGLMDMASDYESGSLVEIWSCLVEMKTTVPRGLMDMASDYESGDSGFESRRGSSFVVRTTSGLNCLVASLFGIA